MEEWLEADGLGGFAMGTADGVRTRRYHALLLAAATPPTRRVVLVADLETFLDTPGGSWALSTHHYFPDVRHPDGVERQVGFSADPWPTWRFRLPGGGEVEQQLFVPRGLPLVALWWRYRGGSQASLRVRPLLAARDHHHLQRQNGSFSFGLLVRDGSLVFRPNPNLPEIVCSTNGEYRHDPIWFQRFLYPEERARGLDDLEDLASPGEIRFDLDRGEAVLMFAARGPELPPPPFDGSAAVVHARLAGAERLRRAGHRTRLHRSSEAYLVTSARGPTVIAGYPWFGDWGRDTFIALRGLCLSTGRLEEAQGVLSAWANAIVGGLLPNRFPDDGSAAEYNSVDAALWFILVVVEYLAAAERTAPLTAAERDAFEEAAREILDAFFAGTRYGIRADEDGLLRAGEAGTALTWMDARVGGVPVTPRIGKPVEVQALWLNALAAAAEWDLLYRRALERGLTSFEARFWNPQRGCLYDVVDVDHHPGALDDRIRPNQIFAAGGLPRCLLSPERARQVVDRVEAELWTPLGLRTLARGEPGYLARYAGGVRDRDTAYHQGVVWPWLAGPFIEAWVRSRGSTRQAKQEARRRFLAPLEEGLQRGGIGHLPELADPEAPFAPAGCPFQAWSVGELLRLVEGVLHEAGSPP